MGREEGVQVKKCFFPKNGELLQADLFINKTVGEILFDGYEDELITLADSFKENEYDEEEEEELEEEKTTTKMPMDKFAWFYKVIFNQNFI